MSFRDSIFQLTSKEDDLIYSPPMQPLGTPSFIRHSLDLSVEQLPVPTTPRIEPTTTAPRRRRHSRSKPSISSSIGTSSLEESAMSIPKRVPSQILGISSVTTTVERSSQGADRPLSTTIIIKPSMDLQPTEDPIPPLPLPVPPSPSPPPPALLYVEPYEPLSPPKPRPSTLEPLNLPVTDIRPKQAESSRPLRSLNEMTRKRQSSVDSLVHTPSIHSVSSPSGTSKATPKLSLDLMSSRLPSMPSLPKATEPASIRSSPVATTNDVVRPFMADYSRHFIPKRSNSGPTTPGNAETSRPTTPAFQSALIHTPSPIIVPPRGEKEEPIMLVPVTPAPTSSGPSFTLPSWREKGQVIDSWASKSDPNTSLSISLQKVDSPLEQLVQNIEEAERTAESRKNSAGHVTPLEEPFHPPSPSPYIRQADDSQAAFLVYPQSVVDSPENVADAPLPLQVPSTPEMDISAALKKLLEIDTMNRVTDYAEHETVNLKTTAKTSTNLKALSRENSDSTPGRAAVPVPATSTTPNITTNSLTAAVPSETVPVRSARTLSNAKPPLALRKPSTEHIPITSRGSPLLPTAPPLPPQLPTEPINSIAPISSTSSPPTREAQKASGIGRSLRATSPTPPPKHESPTISTRSAAAVQISSSTTNRAPSPVNDIEPKSTPQRPPPQPASSHTHTRTASRDVHQDSTSRSRSSPTPPATSSHSKHRSNHRSHSSQNAPPSKDLPKIVPSNEQISAPTPQTTESTPKAAPPPPRKSHRSHNSADKEPKHSSSKPMPSVPTAGPTSSSHHGHRKTKSVPVAPAAPIRPPSPAQESLAGTPSSLASSVSDFHPTVLAPPPKKTGLFNFWKKNESAARGSSRDHTSSPTPMPPTHSIGSPLRKMTSRPKEPVHAPVVQRNTPSPIQIQPLSKTAARSISPALKVVATTAAVARSGRPSSKDKGLLSSFKVFGGRRVQSTLSNASMEAVLGYSGNAPNSPAPSSPEMPHSPYPSRDPNSAVQEWRKREAAIQTSRTRRPRPGVTWDVPNSPGSPSM
ncbi:hypothetical protein FRC03_009060 [Tulasnella sp. 419]|nr:hypothetical protein FRC03_009060 [Tulasnella sp. 419]